MIFCRLHLPLREVPGEDEEGDEHGLLQSMRGSENLVSTPLKSAYTRLQLCVSPAGSDHVMRLWAQRGPLFLCGTLRLGRLFQAP